MMTADDLAKYLEKLPDQVVDQFLHWCIFDFIKPLAVQNLRLNEFNDWAKQLDEAHSYPLIHSESYQTLEALADTYHTNKSNYESQETFDKFRRAGQSLNYLWQASQAVVYEPRKLGLFPLFIERANVGVPAETTQQILFTKLREICNDSGINVEE